MHYSIFNRFLYSVILFASLLISGCSENSPSKTSITYKDNVVAAFFNEAELQIETNDQRQELTRALQDMLTLTSDKLRAQRYANYQLEPGKWTLNEILSRYYYARPPLAFHKHLYEDATKDKAKEKINEALKKLKH